GSAGVDLATSVDVTLFDTSVVSIPTGVFGPLGDGNAALLLGRSSTTLMGLFVLPGVIDADFTGEVKIMVWTPTPPCTIPAGTRIAQLVYFRPNPPARAGLTRGTNGFGSTGVPHIYWAQQVTTGRPNLTCTLQTNNQKLTVTGIIDSGADVTVVS
ncbi:POK9 protein, partial [Penelope pileata]|nr:POK9 protein [Penelope pileata]